MIPSFRNRSYQCFVSYSHEDSKFVTELVDWLSAANIRVWLDQTNLGVGQNVASTLPEQISTCRGMLLIASEQSLNSNWVKEEIATALREKTRNPAFAITILRIDQVDVHRHVQKLEEYKWIDLCPDMLQLGTRHLVEVVNSLYRRRPVPSTGGSIDVYVSRSDRTPDETRRSNDACGRFIRHHGLQLIGDAIDQPDFSEDRIRTLMGTCSGHLMVLPARPKESDYRYFEVERKISAALGIPCLVCVEAGSPLPSRLRDVEHLIEMEPVPGLFGEAADVIFESFLDDIRATSPRFSSSIFFAHEYNENQDRNRSARNLLSGVTGLATHVGSDFNSAIGPQQIVEGINRAAWFVGDLASRLDPETGRLEVNVNTCIEVGIALGAGLGFVAAHSVSGKSDRPIYALSIDRTSGAQREAATQGKTRDIPWMLRSGITIQWYKSDIDFLAIIHRVASEHRRRLLNAEIDLQR